MDQDHIGRAKQDMFQFHDDMDIFPNLFIDQVAFDMPAEVIPDPEVAREAWEKLESLNLPKASYEFAKLYYKDGKSLTKVATILKISAQAADARHENLRSEVKKRLKRQEIWETHQLKVCLSKIPGIHRLILCLYYRDLESFVSIVDILGLAYPTVHGVIRQFKIDHKIT